MRVRRGSCKCFLTSAAVLGVFASGVAGAASTPVSLGSALPPRLPVSKGKSFYVSPTGSDRNPGTKRRPWRTVQHAADRLRPGQRVLVRSGTYVGVQFTRSGTANAPLTFAAAAHARPVLVAPAGPRDTYAADITGAYIRLHGFVLQGAQGTSSADVYVEARAHHVEISGNEIRDSADQGIFTDRASHDVQIIGNRIHDNGAGLPGQHQSHGLYLEGTADLVANNLIYNNPHGFGIQMYPANHGSIVVDNTVVGNGFSGIVLGGRVGVSGLTVRNNIFAFNKQWGIAHDAVNPTACVADHNLLFGNTSGPIEDHFGGTDFSGGNLGADPMFVDAGAGDFRVRLHSPAAAQALAAWSEARDFAGRKRGAKPSIGAYEAR
jgi:hypothetical protein